ncbi:glycosyltransferase family 2 protein [Sphingobacterium siyangense]|uniref:glycosyltransferase family 2 protein n=1 Tax=Sphingobacterium TaxID=28453 RepID=UPI00257D8144|nr:MULTISPECIES: glycosyltransferase family 2 protein [Sphingobacterium]
MIKISIIIATYNAGKFLQRSLDSIVPQLNDFVELLIIDGGSKDDTLSIIEHNRKSIFYTVSGQDKGIYDAWNKGISQSRGDWIMFIGADDILLPNAIKNYLDAIGNNPTIDSIDYICAQNEYIDNIGNILKVMGKDPNWSLMRRTMGAAHVASLHSKRNLFDTVGLYDFQNFRICSDYELLLRKGANLKALFIPKHIARMQVGGMSFTDKAIIETYKIRAKHRTVPIFFNQMLFLRDWIAFKLFIFRKKIFGAKF